MKGSSGFTLLELLVSLSIVGVLSAIAVPNFAEHSRRAKVAVVAADLRQFAVGFYAYQADNEVFPPDSHLVLPPGMEEYISLGEWSPTTKLGGNYNWEGPDSYPYAGISITDSTAPIEDLRRLDQFLDDGDLSQGRFRQTPNGRFTYILEE